MGVDKSETCDVPLSRAVFSEASAIGFKAWSRGKMSRRSKIRSDTAVRANPAKLPEVNELKKRRQASRKSPKPQTHTFHNRWLGCTPHQNK